MSKIDRYIFRQLLFGTLWVTLGLLAVMWLTQSLRFIELIVNRGLSFTVFLELTLLLLPNFLTMVLPMALFLVVLFIYNKLSQDRELMVMRAVGVSQFRLARPAIIVGCLMCLIGYSVTLYFLPWSYEKFRTLQLAMRSDVASLLLQAGRFNSPMKNITIYVQERVGENDLIGVMVHDARNPDRPITYMAKRGTLVHTYRGTPRIELANGLQQTVRAKGRIAMLYFDRYSIDLAESGPSGEVRYREPRERWIDDLFTAEPPAIDPQDVSRYRVEGHQRLASPLQNLAFALMALSVLITGGFTRQGQISRVVAAVGFMVVLQVAALGSAQLAVKHLTLFPLLYAAHLLPIFAGLFLLRRSERGKPLFPGGGLMFMRPPRPDGHEGGSA